MNINNMKLNIWLLKFQLFRLKLGHIVAEKTQFDNLCEYWTDLSCSWHICEHFQNKKWKIQIAEKVHNNIISCIFQ